MHQFFKNYEFKPNEINCRCEGCQNLNLLEAREIKMFEDEEKAENEIQMALLNERNREIVSLRKDFDKLVSDVEIQAARLEAWRIQIEEFGKKKISDLTL